MIQILIIALVPLGIALQGIIEEKSRALSNVCQYGPVILLALYGLACSTGALFSRQPVQLRQRSPFLAALFLGFALTTVCSLFAGGLELRSGGIRDTMIVGVTFLAIAGTFRWTSQHFRYFAWAHCLSFCLLGLVRFGNPIDLNLVEGDSPWEHHTLGFVLPVCCLFAYFSRDLPLMGVSGILSLLAMKRIAIIALAAVVVLSLLRLSSRPRAIVTLVLGVLMFLGSHYLDLVIEFLHALCPELKEYRDLFSGRGTLVATVRESAYGQAGLLSILFGHGPGFASKLAVELLSEELKHIHNDYIRIFLDYGLAGSAFWLIILIKMASLSRVSFCLVMYQMIVFATDNTFVYYPHLITLYLFAKIYDLSPSPRTSLPRRRAALVSSMGASGYATIEAVA